MLKGRTFPKALHFLPAMVCLVAIWAVPPLWAHGEGNQNTQASKQETGELASKNQAGSAESKQAEEKQEDAPAEAADRPEEPKNEPPQHLVNRTKSSAWRLSHKAGRDQLDVFEVVDKVLDLTDKQQKALKELKDSVEEEDGKQEDCLHRKCLRKVERILDKDQVPYLKSAVEDLETLQKEQDAAAREFLKVADPEARKEADQQGGRINTSDLTRYMDLPEPVRKDVDRLVKEMYARVEKEMAGQEPPKDLDEKEQRHWRGRRHREAREEAREWYEEQRRQVLNDAHLKRLQELQEAEKEYRHRLSQSHKACVESLQKTMLRARGYDVDAE